jgi:hypothetical protein
MKRARDLEVEALIGAIRSAGAAIGIDGDGCLMMVLPAAIPAATREAFSAAVQGRVDRVIDFLDAEDD